MKIFISLINIALNSLYLIYHSFVQQGARLQLVEGRVHEKSQADGQRRRRMLVQQVEK